MTRRTLHNEDGWVLITATILLSVMLVMGLAAMSLVNSDSHRTREQRETESALNVDEGVLYAQTMVLGQTWPSLSSHPNAVNYCDSTTATPPATAAAATAAQLACPNPANLAGTSTGATFNNVDVKSQTTWKTKVRDNGGALATSYDPTKANLAQGSCASPCNYDYNGDGQLWVQAQTVTRGHPRNVVARMRLEKLSESIPRAAVTAGALSVTNNGNHGGTPIIDATGSQVLVRCTGSGNTCINANDGQISPVMPTPASAGTAPPNLMTADQLARFKQRAVTDGHYFAGCPTASSDLSGAVVWVEGCTNPPNFANNVPTVSCNPPTTNMSSSCVNTDTSPGMLIWHCGRANFQGNFTYHGLLYMVNDSDGTCPATLPQQVGDYTCSNQPSVDDDHDVLNTNGGFAVWGAVAVDGPACLKVGSNNLQIKFDGSVFDTVESYGTVGLVQNTWRELDPRAFPLS
jgi:hypothetical protein